MTTEIHSICIYSDADIHCYKEITNNGLCQYIVHYENPTNNEYGYQLRSLAPKATEAEAMKSIKRIRKRIDKVYAEWDKIDGRNSN